MEGSLVVGKKISGELIEATQLIAYVQGALSSLHLILPDDADAKPAVGDLLQRVKNYQRQAIERLGAAEEGEK